MRNGSVIVKIRIETFIDLTWGLFYRFSVNEPEKEGELLLGHVSMILDMVRDVLCATYRCTDTTSW